VQNVGYQIRVDVWDQVWAHFREGVSDPVQDTVWEAVEWWDRILMIPEHVWVDLRSRFNV
jgi:hypothetical protein